MNDNVSHINYNKRKIQKITNVLCSDGIRRNCYGFGDELDWPWASCFVNAKGKVMRGYVKAADDRIVRWTGKSGQEEKDLVFVSNNPIK